MARIAVVGGGISGLGAAWEPTKAGHQVAALLSGLQAAAELMASLS